jgi:hypothetical protein
MLTKSLCNQVGYDVSLFALKCIQQAEAALYLKEPTGSRLSSATYFHVDCHLTTTAVSSNVAKFSFQFTAIGGMCVNIATSLI